MILCAALFMDVVVLIFLPRKYTFIYKMYHIRTSVLTAKARRKRSAADHLESAATLAAHHVAGVEAAAVVAAAATKNLR